MVPRFHSQRLLFLGYLTKTKTETPRNDPEAHGLMANTLKGEGL